MSETPVDRQAVIDKHHGEQTGSAEAASHGSGSRSLKAGGEFLRALGADLGAVKSRVRLSLAAKHRRPQPPPSPAPSGTPPGPGIGRGIWRVGMVFFGVLVICSGLLSAAMLWVIFGSPLAPLHSDPGAPALRAEAPSSPSVGPSAEATIQPAPPPAATEQPKPIQEAKADTQANPNPPPPAQPGVDAVAATPAQPAAPPAAAEPPKPIQEANAEPPAGSNQPQPAPTDTPTRLGAGQPEMSAKLTDQHPGASCNVDLCAATYKSFHAADCTYQPLGGGPRGICELGIQPAATSVQISRAATDPGPKAPDARAAAVQPVAASAAPDQAGSQCNRLLCAATYKSFHAADCTYQPEGGGPRSLCDLSKGPDKGPADALQQPSRTATDARHSPSEADDNEDIPAGMAQEIAEPTTPDRDGPQCNRSRCAAAYQSFHASDCTYQPEGGGPRRLCEP